MGQIVCTILARGGSKGVPGKNLTPILGLPLICHSIGQARSAGCFHTISVSSDSLEILETAQKFEPSVHLIHRPAELAHDSAPKITAIQHCVTTTQTELDLEFDTIVDLDPTSPLRAVDDIRACIALMETPNTTNVITGSKARRSPYFNLAEVGPDGCARLSKPTEALAIVTRQSSPPCFDMNASIYVWPCAQFLKIPSLWQSQTRLYVMPEERSWDIDSPLDLFVVKELAERRGSLF